MASNAEELDPNAITIVRARVAADTPSLRSSSKETFRPERAKFFRAFVSSLEGE